MDSDRLDRLERLFRAAQLHPVHERGQFLDAACTNDPDLREELESLLQADAAAENESFLAEPPLFLSGNGPADLEGCQIGHYTIARPLGRGGMGDVYLAVREQPYRQYVAVKIIRAGMDTREVVARFEIERQILASLNHQNVARLLDGGLTDDGLPYFVMEYVEGRPITEFCDEERLSVEDRLRLFEKVCHAVHYAHQNLVVHRDLKPSNILVTAHGIPKLLDFGIAKLLNPTLSPMTMPVTRTEMRLMTPEYASPEQVRGETLTTASDVYSLGVVLFELMTGRRPYRFANRSQAEISRTVIEQEPDRPSSVAVRRESYETGDGETITIDPEEVGHDRRLSPQRLRRRLRGDIDNIVLTALRKESDRRYASVEQFAVDIRGYLSGQPISAQRDTRTYRLKKFIRRHRVETIAAAVVLFSLLASLGAALLQARQTLLAHERAESALVQAESALGQSEEVTRFMIGLFAASDPAQALGDTITARQLLERGMVRVEELSGQPTVQAAMLSVIGGVYERLGQYDRAQPLLERALVLRRTQHGESHSDVAQSLKDLGDLHVRRSGYDRADQFYTQALTIWRTLLGTEHVKVAETLDALGDLHRLRSDYEKAEDAYTEALAMRRRLLGDENADVALSMIHLATLYRRMDRNTDAEPLYRDGLAIQRRILGDMHPEVASSLNGLALLRREQADYAEAESLYRHVLLTRLRLYGEEHPEVAESKNNLALLYHERGDYDAAELLYREVLGVRRKTLGPVHPDIAQSLIHLAALLKRREAFEEAERLYREALSMQRTTLGSRHVFVANSLKNLAVFRLNRGEYRGAETYFLQAEDIYRDRYDEDHPRVQEVYRMLVELYTRWGNEDRARRFAALVKTNPPS